MFEIKKLTYIILYILYFVLFIKSKNSILYFFKKIIFYKEMHTFFTHFIKDNINMNAIKNNLRK